MASAGVDLEQSRKEEEQRMLQDARQWLNRGEIEDVRQPRSGATALHVAAAKGYSEVLRYGVGYWKKGTGVSEARCIFWLSVSSCFAGVPS